MTATRPAASTVDAVSPVDAEHVRSRVDAALARFLDQQESRFEDMLPAAGDRTPWLEVLASLRSFLAHGKRLRAAFCYWGWRGAGGDPEDEGIITAAAALELLHAFALVHDDLIDDSDTRRGAPSLHRRHTTRHLESSRSGPAELYGKSVALLLGDLCLGWFHEMLDGSGLPTERLRTARGLVSHSFSELILGQYLDLDEQTARTLSGQRAETVIRYKTAKYTVERPMHLGGVLAGASPELLNSYTDYALPLGEAFQLRDDVLGAFGEAELTGKPVADDLRTRKSTVLVATARSRATREQAEHLDRLFAGYDLTEEQVGQLASLLVRTGALEESENLIATRAEAASGVLGAMPVNGDVRGVLDELVVACTRRVR